MLRVDLRKASKNPVGVWADLPRQNLIIFEKVEEEGRERKTQGGFKGVKMDPDPIILMPLYDVALAPPGVKINPVG